jgi:hypothetical protein
MFQSGFQLLEQLYTNGKNLRQKLGGSGSENKADKWQSF